MFYLVILSVSFCFKYLSNFCVRLHFFSDEQYYYELDPNNVTKDLHNEFQTKSITVIVHGYTDKVRFNGTGLVILNNF